MSGNDWFDDHNAQSQRTSALASRMVGLTQREVLALLDTDTPPGYRIHFIDEDTDNGFRNFDLDARRMYLFTRNGRVIRHESGA